MKSLNDTVLPEVIATYLRKKAIQSPWSISGNIRADFAGAVVIPALAESAHLFATLDSLAQNPPELLERFLVLVVVNNREDAPQNDRADNLLTLERLPAYAANSSLSLAWVDAVSDSLQLPAATGGVGLARKIGFDLALGRLSFGHDPPLLVALDADTLVQEDYLPAVVDHFTRSRSGGAVIPFRHRLEGVAEEQDAIIRYELFLRAYVLGLHLAGSPHAFHTVGSTMACRATAYACAGGMNRRQAGEDFYFLQQLVHTCGVETLRGTVVHPSARPSQRVPFGTGRAVSRLLDGDEQAVRFYHPDCFRVLAAWLQLISDHGRAPVEDILKLAHDLAEQLPVFLKSCQFDAVWPRLQAQNRSTERLQRAFHGWFHGLRTLRLIHHLSTAALPRCSAAQGIPPLLAWGGWSPPATLAQQLEFLRELQSADSIPLKLDPAIKCLPSQVL